MIKRFKTGLLTALLSLVALGSHADRLYVENTQMKAGGECNLDLVLESSDMSQYCAFQYDIVLPQGITAKRDDFKKYVAFYNDDQQSFSIEQLSSGAWRVVCLSATNQRMKGQTGAIMRIIAMGNGSQQEGVSTGSLQNIVFTKLNANGTTSTVRMEASSYNVQVWREATVTARSYTRRYGEQNPVFEYDVTGGSLQGTPQLTCDATATTAPGTYDINVAPGTVKNPYVTYVPGKLTIVSASAALVFDPVSKTYGDAAFTVTPKSNVSGGAITYSSGNTQVVMVSGQTFTIVGAGTATITANQAATANYGATSATFTVNVATREAVLSWSNLTFTYDGKSHVPTAMVTNLVDNDVCNVTVTGAQTNVGSYTATAIALSNANYKLPAANTKTFTITSASSTLAYDPVNKTYGDTPFSVTPKTNVSGGAITYTSGNTAVVKVSGQTFTIVGAGTAIITANQAATSNYGSTSTTFTVSVAQREAVLIWSNLSFTYDGNSHIPTATVQNLVGSDICTVTVMGVQTNAGNHTATATTLGNANYKLPVANTKSFTITKVPLTIFAGNYVKKQGEPMPQWKAEYNGFLPGETEDVLTKQPVFSCDANENSAPGSYVVTVSGAEAQNYDISYQSGILTVAAADQIVVTARSCNREYGDPNPEFKYDVTGGTIQGEPQIICDAIPRSPVNNYPIILRPGTVITPNVQYVDGWLTINKAPLTIIAKSYTIKQGDPLPKFEADYSGFKLNETPAVLTKQPQFSCTAFDSLEPGEYRISVYGYEAKNYDITPVDGMLRIMPADPVVVTIEDCSRSYGDPNPTEWRYSISGGTLNGTPVFSCDAKIDSSVGTYEIRGSRGTVTNPNVQFVSGYLTVNKAPLTITAKSFTISQGDPLPAYEADYSGFKLSETRTVLTQQPQFSCSAFDSSEPGSFPIRAYGAEAKNYSIDYVDGVLTIVETMTEPKLVLTKLWVEGDHMLGQHTVYFNVKNEGTATYNDYLYVCMQLPGQSDVIKYSNVATIAPGTEEPYGVNAYFTVPGIHRIWVAKGYDAQEKLGEIMWEVVAHQEEKDYTLVVRLKNGHEEKYLLKDRPSAWPSGSKLNIGTTTLSASYERTDIEEFYFLDKNGNSSSIKDIAQNEPDLTVRQLSQGRLQVDGLEDGGIVRVYDISGRLLNTMKTDGVSPVSIDLSQQPKGVYIININNSRTIKIQVK